MSEARILLVDDNQEIREIVNILLSGEGYLVEEAKDGIQALELIQKHPYDLIILDVLMPNLNGYQTCKEIRKMSNAPVLFLSAKSQVEDKTMGFSSGGDDYLPKPFSYNELVGRAKALMRRYHVYRGKERQQEERIVEIQEIKINVTEETVQAKGMDVILTDIELAILLLLVNNRKQIFSARQLYETIWNEEYYYGASNTVMVHIRNIRNKIETDPHNPLIIKTVWGKGYRCD